MQWEYTAIKSTLWRLDGQKLLTQHGRDGWEIVTVTSLGKDQHGDEHFWFLFKRPVTCGERLGRWIATKLGMDVGRFGAR